jgi:hypothetical protein
LPSTRPPPSLPRRSARKSLVSTRYACGESFRSRTAARPEPERDVRDRSRVDSNNDLEPWVGISPTDSCTSPRLDRIAEFERRQAAALTWLDEVFAAATDASGVFLLMQANPYDPPSNPAQCPSGFQAFLTRLATRAQQYGKPVMLAHGDDHFFFMDQPFPNPLFSRVQTYGEAKVHWLKVHVDPKSSGVFSIEQKIVRGNP